MNDVLLTVSGEIPEDIEAMIARGERPIADYVAMARSFHADLMDYKKARLLGGWFGKVLEMLGGCNLLLAWVCFTIRGQYRVLFTDGEQIGIPLAFFLKFLSGRQRPRHLMIAHILSVKKKMVVLDWLRLCSHIDLIFVYSTWQKAFIESRWHLQPERVIFTPFMVDADFFSLSKANDPGFPDNSGDEPLPMICSVGLEYRDYPTLLEAVRGLNVRVIIAAASPWSKRSSSVGDRIIPDNVIVQRYTQFELRTVYAESQIVVMPLYPVNFQAGVTAILEAMSMERPLICTRTPGQTDVVVEGETGVYVPPQDVEALRSAIVEMLKQPAKMREMGEKGRVRVLESMSLSQYIARLRQYVLQA
jgi:glycosyltransferase involved in cell wall biosynthesis